MVETYRGRIRRVLEIRDVPVKVPTSGTDPERRRREAEKLVSQLPDDAWTIVLDGTGKQQSSEAFARSLGQRIDRWTGPIVFVLGSDVGLDPTVLEAGREVLSLGKMTLPHELARLVLYEQIYRAVAIRAGINYHR